MEHELQKFSTLLYSEKMNPLLSAIHSQRAEGLLDENDVERIWYPYGRA